MNKKGFTLIELLAVIVILAIIAIIVTPVVTGIITKTKLSADIRSAEGYVDEADNIYADSLINDDKKNLIGINMISNINEALNRNTTGVVRVDDKGKVEMAIIINDKCYMKTKEQGKDQIIVSEDMDNCNISVTPVEPPIECFSYTKVDASNVKITNYNCGVPLTDDPNNLKNKPYALYTDIIIPSTIEGIPVTSIDDGSFQPTSYSTCKGFNKGINSAVIPDTVTSIGSGAFALNTITSVKLSNNLTHIYDWAFQGAKLLEVDIPDSVTQIDNMAFNSNQLRKVKLPANIETITSDDFSDNLIESLEIPSSVKTIEYEAFRNNHINNLTIPNSVTTIEESVFNNNLLPDNQAFIYSRSDSNSDGIAEIDNTKIIGYGGANKNIKIPSNVITIGQESFYSSNIQSITIPSNVKTIEDGAFASNQITSVEIPDTVTSLGAMVFQDNSISSVKIGKGITKLDTQLFMKNHIFEISIPANIETIGWNCFQQNELTSVVIPTTIKKIDRTAFAYNNIKSLSLPLSNIEIGNGAFNRNLIQGDNAFIYARTSTGIDNTILKSYAGNALNAIIPSTVKVISPDAFMWTAITSVEIPNSVTTIDSSSFWGVKGLTNIKIDNTANAIAGAKWGAGASTTLTWLR